MLLHGGPGPGRHRPGTGTSSRCKSYPARHCSCTMSTAESPAHKAGPGPYVRIGVGAGSVHGTTTTLRSAAAGQQEAGHQGAPCPTPPRASGGISLPLDRRTGHPTRSFRIHCGRTSTDHTSVSIISSGITLRMAVAAGSAPCRGPRFRATGEAVAKWPPWR